MSFVRAEVRDTLLRWREAIIGATLVGGGLYFAFTSFGLHRILACIAVGVGALLIWEGIRRARFPADGGGAGVVEVNEREITYFGPVSGGAVSVEDLVRVEIETNDLGPFASDLIWVFDDAQQTLRIPGDAEGASALIDVLSVLPGARYSAVLEAAGDTGVARHLVWEKTAD